MATPQVIGNDQSLATQCLVFIQSLVNQRIGFNFNLTSGDFTCSFDSTGTVIAASARIPTDVKKKSSSPSTKRRNAKRRQLFLENKKRGSSYVDCENPAQSAREKPPLPACNEPPQNKKLGSSSVDCGKPPQSACEEPPQPADNVPPQQSAHKEPTQPSESLCFPSTSESADTSDHSSGHITKKIRMDKVPPLKLLVDVHSFPRYRIQQFDGNSSLSDLNLCENDHQSEHGDDSNMDQSINCPFCDQTLTSTFHQCHGAEQEPTPSHGGENILTLKPFMGPHNKQCVKDRKTWKMDALRCIESTSTSDERRTVIKTLLSKELVMCSCSYEQTLLDLSGIQDLKPILTTLEHCLTNNRTLFDEQT